MFKDFKPAFTFLLTFLAIYFVGNIVYGIFIESYGNKPDPATRVVATQTGGVLRGVGYNCTVSDNPNGPQVLMKESDKLVLRVYEGCNGINVMIVFVAFLIAFRGPIVKLAWFLPAGIVVIHLANLLRIYLLYYTAQHHQKFFYYFHKYFFTAVLYLIVMALWAVWVMLLNGKFKAKTAAAHTEER